MKKRIWFIVLISCLLCGCIRRGRTLDSQLMDSREVDFSEENENNKEDITEQWEKGYDLPINETERKEAEDECKKVLVLISDIYILADKGDAVNPVLDDKTIYKMQDRIKEKGYPVTTMKAYAAMENYKRVEAFLKNCQDEKAGSVVLYELHSDGGIGRDKFIFDGKDMYLISACATWNSNDTYGMSYISYARIKEWKYTEKGWFGYELCVPEPPEVTEIVDGSCLVRIKPMTKEQREMSEKCVQGLGYQGNNLLCSNWDTDHMEKLDYNGMYVKVILSGEEQFDEQIILNFDGTVDMKPLPNTEVSEQENDTSVEYTTKPESIDLEESNQKNITEQVDKAKKAESWTMDESNGTMYFFLDEQNGWRLVVVDAAAGSRFYVMERTADGGDTWERINEDPFDNQAGVAEGVMFLDDNFGIAGLAGASQSHSTLYITKDGGRSFGEIKLPMSTVTELPESAKEYGFTVEDYDYLNMPQIGATTLIIMVTTDKGDNDGIVFESEDGGDTWKYRGVTQN